MTGVRCCGAMTGRTAVVKGLPPLRGRACHGSSPVQALSLTKGGNDGVGMVERRRLLLPEWRQGVRMCRLPFIAHTNERRHSLLNLTRF